MTIFTTFRSSFVVALLIVGALTATSKSEEGGSGHYLPGSMSSFVDSVPPSETFIARYNLIAYDGDIDVTRSLPIAGRASAGVDATSWAHGLTLLWRPSLDLGDDWSYAMSTTIPFVSMDISADIGPSRVSDSLDGVGDIVIMPLMLNYRVSGDVNTSFRLGIYAPSGDFEVGRLANTGKNFWTFEPVVGLMYFGQQNGVEASFFTGLDFNTENEDTEYRSGTQFHVDSVIAQHLPMLGGLAGVGVNGYWYEQVTGDSGAGALFGDFEGRTAGLGPVISYAGTLGGLDMVVELKWLHEIETRNRLEGDYAWLKFVLKS